MPFLLKATKAMSDRLPKAISPGAHAVIDYGIAGMFFLVGAFMWKRNRPAAISAFICGGSEALVAMVTDYPGGIIREIGLPTHGRIDLGLAFFTSMLPEFMNFDDDRESRFFGAQAITMTAVTGLTDFTGTGRPKQFRELQKAA